MRIQIGSASSWFNDEQTERKYGERLKRFDYDGKTYDDYIE